MKTILLFLGIVACYAVLSLAASPLDASLTPSQGAPLPGANGRPVVVEATTKPVIPVERSRSAAIGAQRPSSIGTAPTTIIRPLPRNESAKLGEPRQSIVEPGLEPGLHSFEQFAPYIRRSEPQGASATSREYLRDPWVIEDLVLL